MKILFQIVILIIAFPGFVLSQSKCRCKLVDQVITDYKNFYSKSNLWNLSLGIGYAGFHANTSFDEEIQDFYNDYIKSKTTNEISKLVKTFGDGKITVPIYLTAALIGKLSEDTKVGATIGNWGQLCSRTLIVGAPTVLTLQILLGASRPEEGKGSRWRPFKDNNGVSGHSFMGAVPFLVAAKMTNKLLFKYSFLFTSTLTGISRINDNKHYFSQSFLGWWIAFLAVNSIDINEIALTPSKNGIRVMIYF